MSAKIIDGKAVAASVRERVRADVESSGLRPGLATILVGDDPASHIYVRNKRNAAAEVGIESFHHELPADTPQPELAELLRSLNADDAVNGILLQLPVPDQIDSGEMIDLIDPLKDVDGLTTVNAGLLVQGVWWESKALASRLFDDALERLAQQLGAKTVARSKSKR